MNVLRMRAYAWRVPARTLQGHSDVSAIQVTPLYLGRKDVMVG